ncbi:DUF1007 family protein [Pseudodesulfovibrio sp.]|uniref:HoxN/HupN/NixA family nickel/cobalt transporter n=1 Tax=Pseudodesulfovibrio sp. TaxID=2035812 RepID=UPI002604CA6E|nr:DUF1007 family protein [Pseudodesulfovibrio sp.]MDD3311282.1 DUF1007 family protein [Pseudodesulfovibrio sp.]
MRAPIRILLPALLALLLWAAPAHAHPHVYVDVSLTFELDGTGLAALCEDWLFDDLFTNAILAELGLDPAALATPEGQAAIKAGAFDNLANFGYFTFLENGGGRLPVGQVRDFRASLREGRLAYAFTVPVHLSSAEMRGFRAAVFDREYYTDMLLLEDRIAIAGPGAERAGFSIRPAKDRTYWQFIVPQAVHLSVRGPGGGTSPLLTGGEEPAVPAGTLSLLERAMNLVRQAQKALTLKLNGFGLGIRSAPLGPALWWFLAFSFLYGIVHAVGPGHGKAVVCSYFLSRPGSFFSGALMGNAITFVHMSSAAVAVALAYALFSTGMGGVTEASLALQPVSYALVALVGLFLLLNTARGLWRGGLLAEPGCSAPAGAAAPESLRQILLVSLVTGLAPCPGAAVILAFAVGQQILWAGLLAVVAMAAGMGVTTTLFAWGAVAARSATLRLSSANRRVFNWLYGALALCGGLAITLIGTALFMSSSVWH